MIDKFNDWMTKMYARLN